MLENQLKSLIEKLAEKHGGTFCVTPDQNKPNLHLWLISESGLMAHVWTFTSRHQETGRQSAAKEAVFILKDHLEGTRNDRLSAAIQHAKERLAAKGIF